MSVRKSDIRDYFLPVPRRRIARRKPNKQAASKNAAPKKQTAPKKVTPKKVTPKKVTPKKVTPKKLVKELQKERKNAQRLPIREGASGPYAKFAKKMTITPIPKDPNMVEPEWTGAVYVINSTKRVYFQAANEKDARFKIEQLQVTKKFTEKQNIFLQPIRVCFPNDNLWFLFTVTDKKYYTFWDKKKLASVIPKKPVKKKGKKD